MSAQKGCAPGSELCSVKLKISMKKDLTFFSADGTGLTSTAANHVANLAKEMISDLEASLAEMRFVTESVSLIGDTTANTLSRGVADADVNTVELKLRQIAEAKSLIAWLREAIKAKEKMGKEAETLSREDYLKEKGLEEPKKPELLTQITEADYWAKQPVEDRCQYYTLEAFAATLGQAIHPGGSFADARKELQTKSKQPHEAHGTGRDTLIHAFIPSVEGQVVEDTYFHLQSEYRRVQGELNALRHKCIVQMCETNQAIRIKIRQNRRAYEAMQAELNNEYDDYISSLCKEIEELKIIIPKSLQRIYQTVTSLGK